MLFRIRSVSNTRLSQDHDDELYLPGSGKIYLTQTKNGRPALGRKKPDLLQDLGFDMLGQSFGIPSRADFEQQSRRQIPLQSRRMSIGSQSSGIITAPHTPRQGRGILKEPPSRRVYEIEDHQDEQDSQWPATVRKASSTQRTCSSRSSSVPPSATHRGQKSDAENGRHLESVHPRNAYGHFPYPPPGSYYVPYPPHPLPAVYNHHPLMNGMGDASRMANHPGLASHPAAPISGYPASLMPNDARGWAQQQLPGQYTNPLEPSFPQATPMPSMPYSQHIPPYSTAAPHSQMQTRAAATMVPPPPPPPPISHVPIPMNSGKLGQPRNVLHLGSDQAKGQPADFPEAATTGKSRVDKTNGKNKVEDEYKERRELIRKRTRHVHHCLLCGTKRSKAYHRAHPLKRGQVPEPDYCHKCVARAMRCVPESAASDSDASTYAEDRFESAPSTDEGQLRASGDYVRGKTRHGIRSRWTRKSRRPNLISSCLPSVTESRTSYTSSAQSLSSAEESISRSSSPTRCSKASRSGHRNSRSPGQHSKGRSSNRAHLSRRSEWEEYSETTPKAHRNNGVTMLAVPKTDHRGRLPSPENSQIGLNPRERLAPSPFTPLVATHGGSQSRRSKGVQCTLSGEAHKGRPGAQLQAPMSQLSSESSSRASSNTSSRQRANDTAHGRYQSPRARNESSELLGMLRSNIHSDNHRPKYDKDHAGEEGQQPDHFENPLHDTSSSSPLYVGKATQVTGSYHHWAADDHGAERCGSSKVHESKSQTKVGSENGAESAAKPASYPGVDLSDLAGWWKQPNYREPRTPTDDEPRTPRDPLHASERAFPVFINHDDS
ncbi:hypothetical protein F5Y15DRAFT_423873 [Xylariaceae sp. FL0016]|nr:hypothetical protein F5Y15DRAFT_423873 [Xylariaceae sp. FL0016]